MNHKYADLAKEIPIHGRNGIIKLGAELEKDFFGWDTFSVRYCLVDGCGMIPEEMQQQHTHDYDQILLFISAEPADMLNLGAEVEVDMGAENIRHLVAIPYGVAVPRGTPHFSPIVRRLDRPFYFLSINCTGKMSASPADPAAVPQSGPWNKFFGEFSNCFRHLTFAVNDPFHYGSERSQPSGGLSSMLQGADDSPFKLTAVWTTVHLPHHLGPWKEDGLYHPHVHQENDEALILLSLDQNNLTDLHGTAEFCVGEDGDDQERFVLTKATAMCMKRGTWHLPMTYLKVDRPSVFFTIGER
jgi:hypothetical protein